jgi:hypothetical protein
MVQTGRSRVRQRGEKCGWWGKKQGDEMRERKRKYKLNNKI